MGSLQRLIDTDYPSSRDSVPEGAARLIATLDDVLRECKESEERSPDVVVRAEMQALHSLKNAIEDQWPLEQPYSKAFQIGPIAAKNIADWNPALADSLMQLDSTFRHADERARESDSSE